MFVATDEKLAVSARAGVADDFDSLVSRHAGRVYAFCLRTTGSAQDAEDLTQATFLAAYESLGNYNSDRPFTPWLFGIAANQCRMWHRRRHRTPETPGRVLETVEDPLPTPESVYEQAESAATIRRVLSGMPGTYRDAVALRCLEGMSTREIADALGLSLEAAAKRLARGMHMVRERLESRGISVAHIG
jgi:RNA polymerase sigma factor (sigma-70 family)